MKLISPILGIISAGILAGAVWADALTPPPVAPIQPVTEKLWGRVVTDNYRYMEKLDSGTLAWMKAQGAYTRAVMDSITPRAELKKKIASFMASFGFVRSYAYYSGRAFYEKQAPGSDNYDLMTRDASGEHKLVDIAKLRAAHGGQPYAINYFLASPDGSKVAVGISAGGSEEAQLSVFDAVSGRIIAGPIDRARFGVSSWSQDSQRLFLLRLKKMAPGEPETDRERFVSVQAWDLKSEPISLAGNGAGKVAVSPDEQPAVLVFPGSPVALLMSINGAQNEVKLWWAPADMAANPNAPWTLLADRADQITFVAARGDELFLLSHKDAPTYQVLAVKAGRPLSQAKVLVPAVPGRVLEGFSAASDGLYVFALEGAYSRLLRVPSGTTKIEEVKLPVRGHVESNILGLLNSQPDVFSDPRMPGVAINLSSWVIPGAEYQYDPRSQRFTDLRLGTGGDIDPSNYVVSDLEAKAHDGAMVPLALIEPKGTSRPQITRVYAYGSYAISTLADFTARGALTVREGIATAFCAVRGGGEKGEAWHLAGKGANKHNTWEDLIACSEYLIAHGITTRDKLFILGGSAGGITIGRALTERPDLFAGAIDVAPLANTLRFEFSANGAVNIPEFGSVKTEQGFKDLYSMDSIAHVKKGTTYPAIMIITGLNDPRVAPWLPAKFAAALQASGTPNPVLLRVDAEAGHGIVSTRAQNDDLLADMISFIFWRGGKPGWTPTSVAY